MTTTQAQRQRKALEPDFFQLSELSFEQILVWARELAREIPYRDENNHLNGNWAQMFEQDELVICASILSIDIEDYKLRFRQIEPMGESITLHYLLNIFIEMNHWYHYLSSRSVHAYPLKLTLLNTFQQQLTEPLAHLRQKIPEKQQLFAEFDPLWQQRPHVNTAPPRNMVRHCFSRLMATISQLQQYCRQFQQSDKNSGEHAPQLALYMSFITLFIRAREQSGQLLQRHLEFYYRDVLGQQRIEPPLDHAYLKLALANRSATPLHLEAKARFSPGYDPKFQRLDYRSQEAISVSSAEVTNVKTLTFLHDPLIAPEHELGISAAAVGQSVSLDPKSTLGQFSAQQRFKLFGHEASDNLPFGVAIADPILRMEQGQRQLCIEIYFRELLGSSIAQQLFRFEGELSLAARRDELKALFTQLYRGHCQGWFTPDNASQTVAQALCQISDKQIEALTAQTRSEQFYTLYRYFFLALLQITEEPETFYQLFGQLISRHTLSPKGWLTTTDQRLIKRKARKLLPQAARDTITELIEQPREVVFYRLYEDIFTLSLTTSEGWQRVPHPHILPLETTSSQRYGLRLSIQLSAGFPAIVATDPTLHEPHWQTSNPTLQINLKPQSNCFPYAIFQFFEWHAVQLKAQVSGLTHLELFNNEGQTDPSQPFMPFGIQPSCESYLVIASEELARKQLCAIELELSWAELPHGSDGFRQHYERYDFPYRNDSFQATFNVLNEGQWRAISASSYPLFTPDKGSLNQEQQIFATLQQPFKPLTSLWPQQPYSQQSSVRNGLFRLNLCAPEYAFGHHQYPSLLTKTLVANSKTKKPQPLPNEPYTPMLNRLAINYQAQTLIELDSMSKASSAQVFHLHPFGSEPIYPRTDHRLIAHRLFAHYADESYLFIGIDALELSGTINLFFLLDGSSRIFSPNTASSYHWRYLHHDHWHTLSPHQIIADTTQGFINSGIITLELPLGANRQHQIMPDGQYWLSVSIQKSVGLYPSCQHIATHVVEVQGTLDPLLGAVGDWQALPKPANLATINQLTSLSTGTAEESHQHWIQRISEQLRHKGQAITPWDYEHLILEHFPQVDSASCFSSQLYDHSAPAPGRLLIIVAPKIEHCRHSPCQRGEFSSALLLKIRDYLLTKSGNDCQIEVRNPGYETLQVRVQITFESEYHQAAEVRRLEQQINQYLCPWHNDSANMGLGWRLSLAKLAAFIAHLPGVAEVGGLSVLKITQQHQIDYHLQDSAASCESIQAEYPWYMLLPAEHHSIQVTAEAQLSKPQPIGLGELVIGEQFIINSAQTTSAQKG